MTLDVAAPLDSQPRADAAYDGTAKAFHWVVVLLLTCQYLTALLLPHIRMDTPLDTTVNLHFNIGIIIVVVMAARLIHRWAHPMRWVSAETVGWDRTLANAMHRIFYAILLTVPFLGWASASAHGIPVRLLGLMTLPAIAQRKAEWGLTAGDIHGYAMWTLLVLIGGHAAAALYHHFFRRDDVLRRMLPR